MTPEIVIQGGALVLLASVLGGMYRLVLRALPIVRDLVRVLAAVERGLADVTARVARLDGRGVCPVLEARAGDERRPTEPEVLT